MIYQLEQDISKLIERYYDLNERPNISLELTNKDFGGHLTVVVFSLLKYSKASPEQTAQQLGDFLASKLEVIESFNVVKGFLNLVISDAFWIDAFALNIKKERLGLPMPNSSGKTYLVEYASPNTNKPLHLGHLLNIFLGYSVSKIYKALGHSVVKTQIVNDRGIHICKSMVAWQKFAHGATPEIEGLKGDFFVGKYYVLFDKTYKAEVADLVSSGKPESEAKELSPILLEARKMLKLWEEGDETVMKLWKTMNNWVYEGFEKTYDSIGIDFDDTNYESETYLIGKTVVEEALNKGLLYKKEDGSVWASMSEENMDDKLLLRADGTSVYMTQDIGTAIKRYETYQPISGVIYTVGNEQNHHFKVLFKVLEKLGYTWAKDCFHLSYGMVELPSGKMKSREGTTVEADDLVKRITNKVEHNSADRDTLDQYSLSEKKMLYSKVALAGIKYFLLKSDPKKGMIFDINESIDINGNTGPFIQYTYVRIHSLLQKAEQNTDAGVSGVALLEKEVSIIMQLLNFTESVEEAGKQFKPSIISSYVYKLSKLYNTYYQSVNILREPNSQIKHFRLELSKQVSLVIKASLDLMGIQVVEKM